MSTVNLLKGGCQCGRLRYEITLPALNPQSAVSNFYYCQCSTCRRLSGSAFLSFLEVPRASFRWIVDGDDGAPSSALTYGEMLGRPAGPLSQLNVSGIATRTFCNRCGSPLTMLYDADAQRISPTLGSLDVGALESAGVLVHGEEGVGLLREKGCVIYAAGVPAWADVGVVKQLTRKKSGPLSAQCDDG